MMVESSCTASSDSRNRVGSTRSMHSWAFVEWHPQTSCLARAQSRYVAGKLQLGASSLREATNSAALSVGPCRHVWKSKQACTTFVVCLKWRRMAAHKTSCIVAAYAIVATTGSFPNCLSPSCPGRLNSRLFFVDALKASPTPAQPTATRRRMPRSK